MTSSRMPLMLDEHMDGMGGDLPHVDIGVDVDVDVDLFGDDVLAITPRPPSKQLLQRLDELRTRGCCRSMAWSKQGAIASISPDGTSIDLRFLRIHPSDAVWDLSEPTNYTVPDALPGVPIVHLAWAATNNPELAVVDAFGRISILLFNNMINRPHEIRSRKNDAADDLHSVVGCYWLPMFPPTKQFIPVHGPAIRIGETWEYRTSITAAYGPWHPNASKSAFVCVTANGVLKLFYAQYQGKIEETQLELESITSSDDLVTHASICHDRGKLLIVLATASRQLKVIQVAIDWGIPQSSDKHPPGGVSLRPSLKENHVAVTSWLQHDTTESHLDASMAHISHLEVLSPAVDMSTNGTKSIVLATILAVRSHVPTVQTPFNLELQSIVDRWEIVVDQPQTLHPAFEQLGSRSGMGSPPTPLTRLRKLESTIINKIIISLSTVQMAKVICLAFSDGTIQYRDRSTMAEVYNEPQPNEVMSPQQVGFHFGEEKPCLQVAFSATNCSFTQLCEDGKIKWNGLRYPVTSTGSSTQDPELPAIIAGLTVVASSAAYQATNYDDILAATQPFARTNRDFTRQWVMNLVQMLKINVDYSDDAPPEALVRNHNLHFCLSLFNHLECRGEFKPRLFSGKFAMLALNVRNVFILVSSASTHSLSQKNTQHNPLDDPQVVDTVASCAKWALDLLAWLTDCLFNLLDDVKFMELLSSGRLSEMNVYLRSKNDVSLHLVVCSYTRSFLAALCRRLSSFENMSNRAVEHYGSKAVTETDPNAIRLRQAYVRMQYYTTNSLVKVQEFEKIIHALSADVKQMYHQRQPTQTPQQQQQQQPSKPGQQPAISDARKAQMFSELNMITGGPPQGYFQPVLLKFFNTDLVGLRNTTDLAALYYAEFDLLEVEDSPKRLDARKAQGRYVDVFRRAELVSPLITGSDAPWRRCTRCASVMEEPRSQNRPSFCLVLSQQKKCSCGGNWAWLPVGSLIS